MVLYNDRGGRAGVESGIYTKSGHGRIVNISWFFLESNLLFTETEYRQRILGYHPLERT